MDRQKAKNIRRRRRITSTRKRVTGTPDRPRLAVRRSLNHIYAQVIDDLRGHTLASASTRDKGVSLDKTGTVDAAAEVGKVLAERAKAAGVSSVSFDRRGARFHGRVKAFAEAARKGGLEF